MHEGGFGLNSLAHETSSIRGNSSKYAKESRACNASGRQVVS